MSLSLYSAARSLGTRFLALPAAVQVLVIYGLSRIWGWIVFSLVARQQQVHPWGRGIPSYQEFIGFWDSGWYQQIAVDGYPQVLPRDATGTVMQNPWAFYPLFPLLAGFLARITGLNYLPLASALALASGFVAALVFYRLSREALQLSAWGRGQDEAHLHRSSLWAVAGLGFLPISAVLQVPYAESFNLIFLGLTLLMLLRGNWLLALPLALLACLSRPVGVPLGAAAGIYWLVNFIEACRARARQSQDQLAPTSLLGAGLKATATQLASALAICGFALLWPLIAWIRTGQIDAYTATETAWRGTHLAPVVPWFTQAELYLGWAGPLLVPLLVLALALLLGSRQVRDTLPPVVLIWCASYWAYLLIFLNPQSSTFRLLLPLFPLLLPLLTLSASRAYRFTLLLAGALGQLWWVSWLWHFKQLPGGGDYPP